MATGRRLISVVTCILFAQGLEVVCAQGAFGSDAIAGIVVACIAVLMIVIGVVIVYLVWRSKRRAAKNTNPSSSSTAQDSTGVEGHSHPADIPIEAVNRIPPPAYTQPTPRRPSVVRHGRSRARGSHPPPPPYSPAQGNTTPAAVDISCDEAPPEYRSRVGLNNSVEPRPSDPQSVSVESFAEYPSMRNILLTSSRSSLQGTDSRHASTQSDRSSSAGTGRVEAAVSMSPAGRPSSRRDSAQGDSAYSKSSPSDDFAGNLRQTHRQISTSSSAINDPRVCVPEGGLQRRARRSKQASSTAATRSAALNRSCPSLEDDDPTTTEINTSHRQQQQQQQQQQHHHHHYDDDDDHHHHRRRRRRVSAENGEGHPKSESTKRGRYQRRREERSSSTEFSSDQLQVNRGYSTDSDLASSHQRYQVVGTTDV